jgi:hypothetical protein
MMRQIGWTPDSKLRLPHRCTRSSGTTSFCASTPACAPRIRSRRAGPVHAEPDADIDVLIEHFKKIRREVAAERAAQRHPPSRREQNMRAVSLGEHETRAIGAPANWDPEKDGHCGVLSVHDTVDDRGHPQ